MSRVRQVIHTALYHFSGAYPTRLFLGAVKYCALRVPSSIGRKVVKLFDPNDIRKRTRLVLAAKYVRAKGIFGERYILNINDHIGWQIYVRGYFDPTPPVLGLLFLKVTPGVYIDVGANIGSSSLAVAKRGGEVLAIEASPAVAHELSANVAANAPVPYAVAMVAATSPEGALQRFATISAPRGNSAASSLITGWNTSNPAAKDAHMTRLATLDALLSFYNVSAISIIKVDIEGHEYEALSGLQETLARHAPPLLYEWRPDIARKTGEVLKDLRPLFPPGYRFFGATVQLAYPRALIRLSPFNPGASYENVLALPETLLAQAAVGILVQGKTVEFDVEKLELHAQP